VIIDDEIDEYFEDAGNANIKMFKRFWVEEGTVFVYDVEPVRVKDGMHISPFFIVTFDNMSDEVVYGVGPSVVEALRDAADKWSQNNQDDMYNPFVHALDQFKRDI